MRLHISCVHRICMVLKISESSGPISFKNQYIRKTSAVKFLHAGLIITIFKFEN
jgi:hypothetical protein